MNGGTLDLAGSTIDASEDRQIFDGTGKVRSLPSARPEWFASPANEVYPEAALRVAFEAIVPGGTVLLAEHTYISPFFDPESAGSCGGRTVSVDGSLTLLGSKRPVPDSDTTPTRLVGGSIIRGEICGTGALHLSNVGVDEGPFVVAHDFGGKESFGIQLASTGELGRVQGTSLEDVSVLTNGMKDQHSVIIEGQRNATVRDIWIWSRGGTHGLVIKSFASQVQNFHCSGASANCLILKSDFVTDHAGEASDVQVDGVFIHALNHPGDTGGIEIEGRWDSLRRIKLTRVREEDLKFGIVASDSLLHTLSDLLIEDWTATRMSGPCLVLDGTRRVDVDRFRCSVLGVAPGAAFVLRGRKAHLRHGVIQCAGLERDCRDTRLDGVEDSGIGNRIENLKGVDLGGYLVRSSPHSGGTLVQALDASAMGSRALSPFHPPERTLAQILKSWIATCKSLLRIVWTQAGTELRSMTTRMRFVAGGWILLLAGGCAFWMRRRHRED